LRKLVPRCREAYFGDSNQGLQTTVRTAFAEAATMGQYAGGEGAEMH